MKVISILEPFASLIKEDIKRIETRSWKTKYRGEIYIHASKKKVGKKDERVNKLVNYLKDKDFKYGAIIAKAKLVDCIYMDEIFLQNISENKIEKECGHYEVGRYAWILEDVEVLDEPIYANGQLGIWNYPVIEDEREQISFEL
jgi:ASCH domain.